MPTINVRQVSEEAVRKLKRRAVANNRSLESEARHILELAAEDDMTEKLKDFRDLSQQLRQQTGRITQTPAEALIREDRDGGPGISRGRFLAADL